MKRKFSLHTKEVSYACIGSMIYIPSPKYYEKCQNQTEITRILIAHLESFALNSFSLYAAC